MKKAIQISLAELLIEKLFCYNMPITGKFYYEYKKKESEQDYKVG